MALQVISSEWIFHARFPISLLVVFFVTLSHLLFFFFSSFFLALFLTSGDSIVTKIRPMEEDIAKLRGFHLHISHNTPCLLPKMSFISLRTTLIPRRNKKQRLRKVLAGSNKVYYRRCENSEWPVL